SGKVGPPIVEVLTTGQTVLPPTLHPDTERPYRWVTEKTLFVRPLWNLPAITTAHMEALRLVLGPWCEPPRMRAKQYLRPDETYPRGRMRQYAAAALRHATSRLLATRDGARNVRLFLESCQMGIFVNNGVLAG